MTLWEAGDARSRPAARPARETQIMEAAPKAVVPFLKIPPEGAPYLEGFRCGACDAVVLEDRRGCPSCCAVGSLAPARLAHRGRLYKYTIVHRSFPGVPTPFISAIVDLEGGGSLKGNLIDVAPEPDAIAFDMPVKVVIRDAGRTDAQGGSYLAYFFVPDASEQRP
jgi:uncharacterized OB-fold protein